MQGYSILGATGTHQGDRDYQQDRVGIFPHLRVAGCVLGVVADGIGGRTGGRKAADQVLLTSSQLFERYAPDQDDAQQLLTDIANEAHTVIHLTAISAEQDPHSTFAAFIVDPDNTCHWAHCGDSRLYYFRDGHLLKRTRDHSYVQTLIDRGQLTEQEARDAPQSNILTSCLGTPRPPNVQYNVFARMQIGDAVLACSDGLWHYVNDEDLGGALLALEPRKACEYLIGKARARARGEGDNISVAIIKVVAVN